MVKGTYFNIILCFFIIQTCVMAQYPSGKSLTLEHKIVVAQKIQKTSPEDAIVSLNEVISIALKEKKFFVVGKSYAILGDIFEDIQQYDLAVDRYKLGLTYLNLSNLSTEKQSEVKAEINLKLGNAYIKLKDYDPAEISYLDGLNSSKDSTLLLLSLIHI